MHICNDIYQKPKTLERDNNSREMITYQCATLLYYVRHN